jgi:hypothetical protein
VAESSLLATALTVTAAYMACGRRLRSLEDEVCLERNYTEVSCCVLTGYLIRYLANMRGLRLYLITMGIAESDFAGNHSDFDSCWAI